MRDAGGGAAARKGSNTHAASGAIKSSSTGPSVQSFSANPLGAGTKQFEGRSESKKEITEPWEQRRADVAEVLGHPAFDAAIGVVILLNAVAIGVEQSLSIKGQDTSVPRACEHIFLIIYTIELGLRFFAFGRGCLKERWVRFDLFLVVLGILTTWIIEPFSGDLPAALNPLMVLRTTRLLRVGKTMKLFIRVEECWMLVRGFLNSAGIICYTCVVWFLTLYVFSCLGVEIITKHVLNESDPEFTAVVQKYFSSLPQTMVTLVRFACLDNTGAVYQPLVDKDPWLFGYFGAIILTVSVVLFHTLGAVIFSCVLDQNSNEHEVAKAAKQFEWEKLVCDLRDMFIRLDTDRSGYLSRKEVAHISDEDREQLQEALGLHTPMQVFDALDVDLSGEVSISEFFDGVWDCVLSKGKLPLKRMEKQVETIHWRLKQMFSAQHDMTCQFQRIEESIRSLKVEVGVVKAQSSANMTAASGISGESSPPTTASAVSSLPKATTTLPKARGSSKSEKRPVSSKQAAADELLIKMERIVQDSLVPTLMQMKESGMPSGGGDLAGGVSRSGSFRRTASPGGGDSAGGGSRSGSFRRTASPGAPGSLRHLAAAAPAAAPAPRRQISPMGSRKASAAAAAAGAEVAKEPVRTPIESADAVPTSPDGTPAMAVGVEVIGVGGATAAGRTMADGSGGCGAEVAPATASAPAGMRGSLEDIEGGYPAMTPVRVQM